MTNFQDVPPARRWLPLLAAVLLPACIQTCQSTPSEGVLTSNLQASYRVTAQGDGWTKIAADLRVGGGLSNVYVSLQGSDRIEMTRGQTTVPLTARNDPFGRVWYQGALEGDSGGQTVTVGFLRQVDPGAPQSSVVMPPSFQLVSPTPNASLSRTQDEVTIQWSNTSLADGVNVSVSGSCIETYNRNFDVDPGVLVLPAGSLRPAVMQQVEMTPTSGPSGVAPAGQPVAVGVEEKCRVTAKITRTRQGSIDPRFGMGGSITAVQDRQVEFICVP